MFVPVDSKSIRGVTFEPQIKHHTHTLYLCIEDGVPHPNLYTKYKGKCFTPWWEGHVHRFNVHRCVVDGCSNIAFYAKFYSFPVVCQDHREGYHHPFMVCRCGSAQPDYGFDENKLECCMDCSKLGMVRRPLSQCASPHCTKRARYNYKSQLNARFCTIYSNCLHEECCRPHWDLNP